MCSISGVLNVFYPFELKDNTALRQIRRIYERNRDRQIKRTRHLQRPRTDLMDMGSLRNEMESTVALGQELMGGIHMSGCAPYATPTLAQAYHKDREDNLFVEEASVIISSFIVDCPGVSHPDSPLEGMLYYFNNLANHVGTYMVALKFKNLSVDDVIRMKHVFYKRAKALISEQPIGDVPNQEKVHGWMTFPEYVSLKARDQSYRRKTDIDFRARYSMLEIEHDCPPKRESFGMLTANEKYLSLDEKKTNIKNYSKTTVYSLYYDLRSGMIVNHTDYNKTRQRQSNFFRPLQFGQEQIPVEMIENDEWIAGLEEGKFPEFLKAVEIHLLTNNTMRHETVRHKPSYLNPYSFLRRRYKIWKILYELDTSHCFINNDMLENFEVNKNMKELRDEFKHLTSHVGNYIMVVISISSVLVALLTYIK